MNEQTYEQEIDLGLLIYRIFREWRKCIVIALIIAAVVGAVNFVAKGIEVSTPEKLERAKLDYERELAAYKAEGESLQREIENIEEKRAQQEVYNEESVVMKINPFSEYNAFVQLYISTDYQIVPDLVYQDIDLSVRILNSYVAYMRNGEMYQYILDRLTQKTELRYLQELFSVSPDYESRMVTLSIRNVDEQSCEEILGYALEGIHAKQDEIQTTIGEHELSTLNQSKYETVNLDLDTWQKNNQQYILDLNASLKERVDNLAKWRLKPEPKKEYEKAAIAKDSCKKAIIGFIVAGVLAAMFIAFRSIISDKVQDAKSLKSRFGLRVVAQIPKVHGKRVWGMIDTMFAKMWGVAVKESDAEQLIEVAAQSMSAELMARKGDGPDAAATDGGKKEIVFTGSIAQEEIKTLLSTMNWGSEFMISSASSVLQDPAAVPKVIDADYVILVERQEESRYSQIERELEEFRAWKKEVLGVIVLGVDGIPA